MMKQSINERFQALMMQFLVWRLKHLSNRTFIILLAVIIGLFTGLAAVLMKTLINSLRIMLTGGFDTQFANFWYIVFPLFGILLTVMISRWLLNERPSHGVTDIIYSISKGSANLPPIKMISRLLTSVVTTGFGGSVGIEAPISVTGSAFGSNLGKSMRLNYKSRSLLIGCGSSAAIAAMFNSPIAGVIFAIEVILVEVNITSFIPLLIASVSGALMAGVFLGNDTLFFFNLTDEFRLPDVPLFMGLGVTCGLISLYFIRINFAVEELAAKVNNVYLKAIFGGLALGLIIFIFPPIFGEGYNSIKFLLEGQMPALFNASFFASEIDNTLIIPIFLICIILLKPLATALTISAGGGGGVFAPSLFVGGITGYTFAFIYNLINPNSPISLSNFTLVGMCGIMSAVLHAPLTAIFLIAEITSGYGLFIPLMLVSAIAYSTIYYFERNSIYTKKLVEQGDLITHDKDLQLLSLLDLQKLIEKDILTIHPDASLDNLVQLVKASKRNIFPVVDEQGQLQGIITLDDIREKMFDVDLRKTISVRALMHSPPGQISFKDDMKQVMTKFENTGAWNLPVIEEGRYMGLISKSTIFNAYRKKLIRQARD
jgi:CIC family chloride channel protein